MRTLIELLAGVCWLAGLVLVGIALSTPGKYPLAMASAAQISQVYAEASYYALIAIAAFLSGILMMASLPKNE